MTKNDIVLFLSQEDALAFLKSGDLTQLTNLLAEICPVEDNGNDIEKGRDKTPFPLPQDHWINRPYGKEEGFRTILEIAVDMGREAAVKYELFFQGIVAGSIDVV